MLIMLGCAIQPDIVIKYKCPAFTPYSQDEIINTAKEMQRLAIDSNNPIWQFIDKSYLNYATCKELENEK